MLVASFSFWYTIITDFEWDPSKAESNLRKHGITFHEAATVFNDPLAVTAPDPDHSYDEEREVTFGISRQNRLLAVVHTDRGVKTRIISARFATRAEKHMYES